MSDTPIVSITTPTCYALLDSTAYACAYSPASYARGAHARIRQRATCAVYWSNKDPRVPETVLTTLLSFSTPKLRMANVFKVISVLEEVADMLKSGQTESPSSNAGQGSSTSHGNRAAYLSNRSEPRSLSRATTSTNLTTQVGRTELR